MKDKTEELTPEQERAAKIINNMIDLIEDARADRKDWETRCDEIEGVYNRDLDILFGKGSSRNLVDVLNGAATESDVARYHHPMLNIYSESFCASLNGSDIEPKAVPKIDQDFFDDKTGQNVPVDMVARMMNAAFESCRTVGEWNHFMHIMGKKAYLYGRHYLGVAMDYVKTYPDALPCIRSYSPWELYHTPGVPLNAAREAVIVQYIDKEELMAQYPEFADEIEELETDDQEGQDSSLPAAPGRKNVTRRNTIRVMERFKFDASLKSTNEDRDMAVALQENALVDGFTKGAGPLPAPKLQFDEKQFHTNHNVEHLHKVEEYQNRLEDTVTFRTTNEVGIATIGKMPKEPPEVQAMLQAGIDLLLEHVKLHDAALGDLDDPFMEGKYSKYAGGWRQTTVVGDKVIVFDDASKFYTDEGIRGIPVWDFNLIGDEEWSISCGGMIIDHSRMLDSTVNTTIDNMRLFGNTGFWGTKEVLEDSEFHWSNDPHEPKTVGNNAHFGQNCGFIDAKEIPASTWQFMGLVQSLASSASAIPPVMAGKNDPGVRSAAQTQLLQNQSIGNLMYKLTRCKPSIEGLATAFFKMCLNHPPNDNFVAPMIDGKAVMVDWDLLSRIDFTIEVIINPGGTSSTEERNKINLGVIQNAMQQPALQAPEDMAALFEMMAKSIKNDAPDMAQAYHAFAENLLKRAAEIKQQMAMAAQKGSTSAGAPGSGAMPPQMGQMPTQ